MEMHTHRAAPGAYVFVAGVTWSLAACWLVVVARMHAPWQPVLLPLAGFALAFLWLSRFRVRVGKGTLVFAQPFRPARRCALDDVLSVELDEGPTGRAGRTVCVRLSSGEVLRRSLRVFPPETARQLLALAPTPRLRA